MRARGRIVVQWQPWCLKGAALLAALCVVTVVLNTTTSSTSTSTSSTSRRPALRAQSARAQEWPYTCVKPVLVPDNEGRLQCEVEAVDAAPGDVCGFAWDVHILCAGIPVHARFNPGDRANTFATGRVKMSAGEIKAKGLTPLDFGVVSSGSNTNTQDTLEAALAAQGGRGGVRQDGPKLTHIVVQAFRASAPTPDAVGCVRAYSAEAQARTRPRDETDTTSNSGMAFVEWAPGDLCFVAYDRDCEEGPSDPLRREVTLACDGDQLLSIVQGSGRTWRTCSGESDCRIIESKPTPIPSAPPDVQAIIERNKAVGREASTTGLGRDGSLIDAPPEAWDCVRVRSANSPGAWVPGDQCYVEAKKTAVDADGGDGVMNYVRTYGDLGQSTEWAAHCAAAFEVDVRCNGDTITTAVAPNSGHMLTPNACSKPGDCQAVAVRARRFVQEEPHPCHGVLAHANLGGAAGRITKRKVGDSCAIERVPHWKCENRKDTTSYTDEALCGPVDVAVSCNGAAVSMMLQGGGHMRSVSRPIPPDFDNRCHQQGDCEILGVRPAGDVERGAQWWQGSYQTCHDARPDLLR